MSKDLGLLKQKGIFTEKYSVKQESRGRWGKMLQWRCPVETTNNIDIAQMKVGLYRFAQVFVGLYIKRYSRNEKSLSKNSNVKLRLGAVGLSP